MIQTTTKTIDGIEFQLSPFPVLTAAKLDKKVLAVIAPVLGGLDSLLADIDFEKLSRGIQQALSSMDDFEFLKLILELFSHTKAIAPGQAPIEMTTEEAINKALATGGVLTVYKLAFEVMRYNKFTPFAVASSGDLMSAIAGLRGDAESKKSSSES